MNVVTGRKSYSANAPKSIPPRRANYWEIRTVMHHRGKTGVDAEREIGIKRNYFSMTIRGSRRSAKVQVKIAAWLGVKIDEVFPPDDAA